MASLFAFNRNMEFDCFSKFDKTNMLLLKTCVYYYRFIFVGFSNGVCSEITLTMYKFQCYFPIPSAIWFLCIGANMGVIANVQVFTKDLMHV